MNEAFTNDEIIEIASSLEDYHRIFYVFFEMARVCYTDAVPTAAVRFRKESKPELLFNRSFWESLTHRERLFVVCHECLHVLLRHGDRNGKNIPGSTPQLCNVAQDICINEMIVSVFGYDRDDIRDWKKYCWIDTCFQDPSKVKRNETFDYYLKLLIAGASPNMPELVDEHGDGAGAAGQADADGEQGDPTGAGDDEGPGSIAEQLADELSPEEMAKVAAASPDSDIAGVLEGRQEIWASRKPIKVKFDKIVRHLKRTRIKEVEKDVETFVKNDRRFDDIARRKDVMLPGTHVSTKPEKDKLLTALFMDISGSCVMFVPTFNRVYEAFAREPELFEIRTFTFDTIVREHKPGTRIIGGGGTKFHIIENKIQELKAEYGKYPDCVVLITDGDGNPVDPELPSRWIWLLTPDYTVYRYIHDKSKKYLISNIIV